MVLFFLLLFSFSTNYYFRNWRLEEKLGIRRALFFRLKLLTYALENHTSRDKKKVPFPAESVFAQVFKTFFCAREFLFGTAVCPFKLRLNFFFLEEEEEEEEEEALPSPDRPDFPYFFLLFQRLFVLLSELKSPNQCCPGLQTSTKQEREGMPKS